MTQTNNTKQRLNEAITQMRESIAELDQMKNDLQELNSVKQGSNILAPISSGIYVKATIQNPQELLVNLGSSVVTVKSIEEAKNLIEKQKDEINNSIKDTQKAMENVQ